MSTRAYLKRGLLLTSQLPQGSLISQIKSNGNSFNLSPCQYYCVVAHDEKAKWELHTDATCCFEQILEDAHFKTASVRPLTSHLTNHPRKARKTCWNTAGELRKDSKAIFTDGLRHIDTSVLDQQKLTFVSSGKTLCVVYRIYKVR